MIVLDIERFNWNDLISFDRSVYYIVIHDKDKMADIVPFGTQIQLKVRHFPTLTSEVCGHLYENQIVEAKAILGDDN
jgi:hypothetical protein